VLRALLARVLFEAVGEMHTRHAILFHMVRSDLSVHAAKAWLSVRENGSHQGLARFPQPPLGLEYLGSVVRGLSPQYYMYLYRTNTRRFDYCCTRMCQSKAESESKSTCISHYEQEPQKVLILHDSAQMS
jgi:hypothetical protein